jgi:hypothetical protein
MLSFDPAKNAKNLRKHGISLADSGRFDFGGAVERMELHDGEERIKAIGEWGGEFIAVVIHVDFGDEGRHVISARQATRKETEAYGAEKAAS